MAFFLNGRYKNYNLSSDQGKSRNFKEKVNIFYKLLNELYFYVPLRNPENPVFLIHKKKVCVF